MRKIFTVILSVLIVALCGFAVVSDSAKEAVEPTAITPIADEKYSVTSDFAYRLEKAFDGSPDSMEAWLKFNAKTTGTIMTNYYNPNVKHMGDVYWEVVSKGKIAVYWNSGFYHTFENDDIRDGDWHHVAVVRDAAKATFFLYIDGELADSVVSDQVNAVSTFPYNIGAGYENWGAAKKPLRADIRQVTVYSGAISQERVKQDMENSSINTNDTNATLLGNWYLGETWTKREVEDSSENENSALLVSYEKWVDVYDTGYYDYAIIGFPDIQAMTSKNLTGNRPKLTKLTTWIAENTEKMKFKFAFSVGDLADTNNDVGEYETASKGLSVLDGKLPYSFVQGNHDYDNGCSSSRASSLFNKYFPYNKFKDHPNFGGAYAQGSMSNTYWLYDLEDAKYLVINLEFGARMSVIRWAGRLCEMYPDHRVIIVTHSYLYLDGSIPEEGGKSDPSSYGFAKQTDVSCAQDLYNCLIRRYSNVFMVFSGHNGADDIVSRTDIGEHGNTIRTFMIDLQFSRDRSAGTGLGNDSVLIMKFNEVTKMASFYYYSVEMDACWNHQNQFTFSFADPLNPAIGE